jgi:hypothetical protein
MKLRIALSNDGFANENDGFRLKGEELENVFAAFQAYLLERLGAAFPGADILITEGIGETEFFATGKNSDDVIDAAREHFDAAWEAWCSEGWDAWVASAKE